MNPAAFSLGTIPLLALDQAGVRLVLTRVKPVFHPYLKKSMAGTALVSLWIFYLKG